MKKYNQISQKDTISELYDDKEPLEIIYADPRDAEIHLNFLKRKQINAHMARWFLDHEYNHLIWSDGIFQLLELDPRKHGANFKSFIDVVHPDDRPIKNQIQNELRTISKPIEITYRLLLNDGRIKWINEICSTDFDQEGQPIRSYGTIQDITKYKLLEENYRQKEEQFKNLIDTIPSGIAILQNNKFVFLNPEAKNILEGKSQGKLTGKNISKLLLPEIKVEFLKNIKLVNNGKVFPTFETKFKRMDGSVFDAEITLIHNSFLGNNAIQLVINEITERKKSELALIQSETRLRDLIKTKDKFFSIIAHDLRSPFNSILGFLDLLQSQFDYFDDAEKKSYLKIMEENTSLTFELLSNLLEWANAQTGKISFQPSKQKLHLIIDNIIKTLHSVADVKEIELVNSSPKNMEVIADANMLSTILYNLINNAIKYSYPGGKVTINSIILDDQIRISVQDTGVGIDEETKNKLFRMDEHLSVPGTANEKGSGLGLILCKDFVERHNGEIWVDSEYGKGSKFILSIPQQ